jgi:hypothetical protein
MNTIAGYHGKEIGVQLERERYAVNMVIPVSAKTGEPAVEFIIASTEIQVKAPDSGFGQEMWENMEKRFGEQGLWCFANFLRFGGCVDDKGVPEYLDGLLQHGLEGPSNLVENELLRCRPIRLVLTPVSQERPDDPGDFVRLRDDGDVPMLCLK